MGCNIENSTQTDHPWLFLTNSTREESRYDFARNSNHKDVGLNQQAKASDELVQGILSSVSKRVSWMDTSFTQETGDAGRGVVEKGSSGSSSSWEGSYNSTEVQRENKGDHHEAPSLLWLKQYDRRDIGHCFEEFGKGAIDGVRVTEVLIQRYSDMRFCHHCQKEDLLKQTSEAVEILQGLSGNFVVWPCQVEKSANTIRMLTPCLNTSVAEVVTSRQNLREGLEEHGRFMAACLVEGALYLHSHNIIHRDIMPENVYLDNRGYPKVANFHHAIHAVPGQYVSGECGSVGYQAPEVVAGLGHMHTVDYWGIGCVVYQFLFGFTPFTDEDEGRLKSKTVLNPDFAITRLGNRFRHMSYNGQEAIKSFMCKYPHKRMGYKCQEVSKTKWFQPYRWTCIMNQTMQSPLTIFLKNTHFKSDTDYENYKFVTSNKQPRGPMYDGRYSQPYCTYGAVGQKPRVKGSASSNWLQEESAKASKKTYGSPTRKTRIHHQPQWVGDIVQNAPGLRYNGSHVLQAGDGEHIQCHSPVKKSACEDDLCLSFDQDIGGREFHSTPIASTIGDGDLPSAPVVSPVLPEPGYDIWREEIKSPEQERLVINLPKASHRVNGSPQKSAQEPFTHAQRKIASAGLVSSANCIFSQNGKPIRITKRPKTVATACNLEQEMNGIKLSVKGKHPNNLPLYSSCGASPTKDHISNSFTPPTSRSSPGKYQHTATPIVKNHPSCKPVSGLQLYVSACSVAQTDRPVTYDRVVPMQAVTPHHLKTAPATKIHVNVPLHIGQQQPVLNYPPPPVPQQPTSHHMQQHQRHHQRMQQPVGHQLPFQHLHTVSVQSLKESEPTNRKQIFQLAPNARAPNIEAAARVPASKCINT